MSKVTVQLVQFNNSYGNNVFLPYSVGVLQAYALKDQQVRDGCDFRPFVYRRAAVDDIARQIGAVDILCLSCYMWNWRLNMALADYMRRQNEKCLIVVGGPQVPDRPEEFFRKHPAVDVAVHGEGEVTLHQLLLAYLNKKPLREVSGLSFHDRTTGEVISSGPRREIAQLEDIPSPYLNGTFSDLMSNDKADWVASWETNRGCPFTCAYCYWGRQTAKMRKFEMGRLFEEIEWFGRNKISLVFGCDSNFGILERDLELVQKLAETKEKYGYPPTFRVCNAKNSNDRVFGVEEILHKSRMAKGISMSLQSLSPEVLDNVKRKNIKMDLFQKLQVRYSQAGMPTYTEMILALPGETYDTFVDGLNSLLVNGQHSQIHLYNLTILVNSEMAEESYRKRFGIQTVEIPIFQQHVTPDHSENRVTEFENIVVATDSMPLADWRRAYEFAWAALCFHYLGIFQMLSVFLYGEYKITYRSFYEGLIRFARKHPDGLLGRELQAFSRILDNVVAGVGFDQFLPEFGDVNWPPEEASFLRLSLHIDALYQEARVFVESLLETHGIPEDPELIDDLMLYQRQRLVHFDDTRRDGPESTLALSCDLPSYIDAVMKGDFPTLRRGMTRYRIVRNQDLNGDKKQFAREIVWYGRKGGKFLYAVQSDAEAGRDCREGTARQERGARA